jgi:hypothetical protein
MPVHDRRCQEGLLRAVFGPPMVPLVHVSGVAFVPVGVQWFPWHASVEDIQDGMKDCVECAFRVGSCLRSVYRRFNGAVEVLTRDLRRPAMVNERRGSGCGLWSHRPVLPDEGGLFAGLDHGTGHFPPGLSLSSPWWTQRRWWEINGCQNRGKHRPRFLTEKSLRCGCAVCTREEKVVNRCQTCTLSRAI